MKVNHEDMRRLMLLHINKGESLMVRGEPGIGKTEGVEDMAAYMAKKLDKKLVVWSKLSQQDKSEFYFKKELRETSYFLSLIDLLAKLPEDLGGLPRSREDFMEWIPDLQFWVLSQPEVHGLAFFDELLQAQQAVQKPVANMFLRGMLGTLKVSDNVAVVGASNRKQDKCGVIDMLEHLKNRMGHVELGVPTADQWVKWAWDNNIDERLISFTMFKPELLFQKLEDRKQDAYPTPRSIAITSNLVKDQVDSDDREFLEAVVASRVGDAYAAAFTSFIELRDQIDCQGCLDNPKRVEGLTLDHKIAFTSWAVENVKKKGHLEKTLRVAEYLGREDLSLMMLSMVKNKIEKPQLKAVLEKPEFEWMYQRLYKYLK